MKRIISCVLSAVMILTCLGTVSFADSSHPDITGHWAEKTMLRAVEDGYIVGMSDGSLDPNGAINRAQLATILNQVFKNTRSTDLSGKTDIPSDAWYYSQLEKATYLGFVATTSAQVMTKPLIRSDTFVNLGTAFGITEANPDKSILNGFSDTSSLSGIYRDAAASFVNAGYAVGYNGQLMGNKNVTRAEFLTMLYAILDRRALFDCTSSNVIIEDGTDPVIHSYDLRTVLGNGSYGTVSFLQSGGDVIFPIDHADEIVVGSGSGKVVITPKSVGAKVDGLDVTGNGRTVEISCNAGEIAIAGNDIHVIIDLGASVDNLYISNRATNCSVTVNGSVGSLQMYGSECSMEGLGSVGQADVDGGTFTANVAGVDDKIRSIINSSSVSLSAPDTLAAGENLTVSATVNNLPSDGTATAYWIVDGARVGDKFSVNSGETYSIAPSIEYSQDMQSDKSVSFELSYSNGIVLECTSTSKTIGIENYSEEYYKSRDVDRVMNTITSYQYQATVTANGNAYSNSDLTGWVCEIWKGETVTCLTPVNTQTVKVKTENGYTGWISTSAIQTGSGNYTLANDFDSTDKTIWVNNRNYSSSTEYLIWVSLACQKVNIFTGSTGNWTLSKVFDCASGAYSTPTPCGTYKISYKQSRWQYNGYWCGPVTGFYNGYAFHSWLNKNDGSAYDHTMGRPVSHGCVRMTDEGAQYMYNLPMNTTVVVY